MSDILVVGMNPSNIKKPRSTTTSVRLQNWMDHIGFSEYDFMNVSDSVGDFTYSVNDLYRLETKAKRYSKVVALGVIVSNILNKVNINHFKTQHPSGRNRNLNDSRFMSEELMRLKNFLEKSVDNC